MNLQTEESHPFRDEPQNTVITTNYQKKYYYTDASNQKTETTYDQQGQSVENEKEWYYQELKGGTTEAFTLESIILVNSEIDVARNGINYQTFYIMTRFKQASTLEVSNFNLNRGSEVNTMNTTYVQRANYSFYNFSNLNITNTQINQINSLFSSNPVEYTLNDYKNQITRMNAIMNSLTASESLVGDPDNANYVAANDGVYDQDFTGTNYYHYYFEKIYIEYKEGIDVLWGYTYRIPDFMDLNITYTVDLETANIDYEVVDIPGLLFEIIAMPFAFISQAFNFTLFPGTIYAINVSHVVLGLLVAGILIFILRIFFK